MLALSYGDPELKRFGAPVRTCNEVGRIIGINARQVANMRARYVNGIVDRRLKQNRNGLHWKQKIAFPASKDIKAELIHPELLRAWAGLSLEDRANKVKDRYPHLHCSKLVLRDFYIKHGIKYRRGDYSYFEAANLTKPLELKRRLFALTLQSLQMLNEPVIFADESQFNVWMQKRYYWQPRDCRVTLPMQPSRGKGFTVLGGVSEIIEKGAFFTFARTTNQESFLQFLDGLKHSLTLPPWKKAYLVLDNHSAHSTASVRTKLAQHFHPLYLPPNTSFLNPAEFLWKLLKHGYKKAVLQKSLDREKISEAMAKEILTGEIGRVTRPTWVSLLNGTRKELHNFITAMEREEEPPVEFTAQIPDWPLLEAPDSKRRSDKI